MVTPIGKINQGSAFPAKIVPSNGNCSDGATLIMPIVVFALSLVSLSITYSIYNKGDQNSDQRS